MKHLFNNLLFFSIIIFISSCAEDPTPDVVIEHNEYKQMMKETEERDSAMIELVKTLNQIDDNIEKITERKKQLKIQPIDVEIVRHTENVS